MALEGSDGAEWLICRGGWCGLVVEFGVEHGFAERRLKMGGRDEVLLDSLLVGLVMALLAEGRDSDRDSPLGWMVVSCEM